VLQQAVIDGVQMRLAYADRTRNESERTVHPLGLVEKRSVWYLVANTGNGMRTFRVSRVRDVTVTDDPVDRPEGFDLAETWQSVVETIESRRTSTKAVVVGPPFLAGALRGQFGPTVRVLEELDDGRVAVEVGRPSAQMLAEQLAGWGDLLEVVDPPEVRQKLHEIGEQLVARYAG
jgi:predicted DNA-binding transcriptional regulator YafY